MVQAQAPDIGVFIAHMLDRCGLSGPLEAPTWSDRVDPDEVLEALAANHVPLLWLGPTGTPSYDRLLESEPLRRAREADQARLDDLRAQTLVVRDEFQRHGIDMAFIKAVDIAPSFPYNTGNQDILVRPDQANLARRLLRKMGHIEVRHIHERKKYLYRTFPGGREGLSVHLHEHVGWDGNTFVEANTLWSRIVTSQRDQEILIPSPEDVVLITVSHAFDENKQVRLADIVKVRYCVAAYDLDWGYMESVASRRGWRDQFYIALHIFNHAHQLFWGTDLLPEAPLARTTFVLKSHRLSSAYLERRVCHSRRELPFNIPFAYAKLWGYKKMMRDPALTWPGRLHLMLEHTLRGIGRKLKLRTQPSMLVCLSGIDGSGKTSQALALQEAFAICEVKAEYVWMRGSTSRWLDPIKRVGEIVLGRRRVAATQGARGAVKNVQRIRNVRNRWLRAIYQWLIFWELGLFYVKHVTVPLLLGRVVICDRYIADHMADWMDQLDDPRAYESLPARLLSRMTPRPSIGILLEIPVQVALARRDDELSQQSVETRVKVLHTLASRYHLEHLDANRPFEIVCEGLVHSVLSRYLDNHWTLVNALFRQNSPLGPSETG